MMPEILRDTVRKPVSPKRKVSKEHAIFRHPDESPLLHGERRTLKDGVYDAIREAIMSGKYEPGLRLTVRGMAAEMGISTMPIREAFRLLTAEGALQSLSTGVTRVPLLDRTTFIALTDARLLIEGDAARRAALSITERELYELREADDDLERAIGCNDLIEEARANERFHFCIYRAARSPELLRIIEGLWLRVGPSLLAVLQERNRVPELRKRKYVRLHKRLIRALATRKADKAEDVLRADLRGGAQVMLRFFDAPAALNTKKSSV